MASPPASSIKEPYEDLDRWLLPKLDEHGAEAAFALLKTKTSSEPAGIRPCAGQMSPPGSAPLSREG